MLTALITGASRGIGLEFSRQFAADGWRVVAACRKPTEAKDLNALAQASGGRIVLETVDVADDASVAALAKRLGDTPIDLLLNNAGIYAGRGQELGGIDFADWGRVMDVNVAGPLRVAQAFVAHLEKGERKLIVSISSRMGSIAESGGGAYLYRASKAALNMVNRNLSIALGPRGFVAVVLHPGWVKTDMGGPNAAVTPEASVAGMRKVVLGLTRDDNGKFQDFEGKPIAW